MNDAAAHIATWLSADAARWAAIVAPGSIAFGFLAFNAVRVALQVARVSAWTWSSWIVASVTNALYIGLLRGDAWGLALNLANALVCTTALGIACVRHRRAASAVSRAPHRSVRSAGVVFFPR